MCLRVHMCVYMCFLSCLCLYFSVSILYGCVLVSVTGLPPDILSIISWFVFVLLLLSGQSGHINALSCRYTLPDPAKMLWVAVATIKRCSNWFTALFCLLETEGKVQVTVALPDKR